jgi:glucan 1,3-beta-glucosidase
MLWRLFLTYSIRVQIGYYHLSNANACPDCLRKTDFEPFAQVYEGAWPRIQKAIQDAEKWGLGILIDLHGVAGNQNDDGQPIRGSLLCA